MNLKIESDVIETSDDGCVFSDTEVPVYQVLAEIASGTPISDVAEEYEVEEAIIAQLLQDISESFR